MANSALNKLIEVFTTRPEGIILNTEIFGKFDADAVAKELNLEKVGAEKGEKNQPSSESQIPDEIETQIQERIEAAKATANESAENQIHSYNERISNLDFEGHFSDRKAIINSSLSSSIGSMSVGGSGINCIPLFLSIEIMSKICCGISSTILRKDADFDVRALCMRGFLRDVS